MEQIYIKRFEEQEGARIIGLSFDTLVIAIYACTIEHVRQETFLVYLNDHHKRKLLNMIKIFFKINIILKIKFNKLILL